MVSNETLNKYESFLSALSVIIQVFHFSVYPMAHSVARAHSQTQSLEKSIPCTGPLSIISFMISLSCERERNRHATMSSTNWNELYLLVRYT